MAPRGKLREDMHVLDLHVLPALRHGNGAQNTRHGRRDGACTTNLADSPLRQATEGTAAAARSPVRAPPAVCRCCSCSSQQRQNCVRLLMEDVGGLQLITLPEMPRGAFPRSGELTACQTACQARWSCGGAEHGQRERARLRTWV
jgi:hypothetical protein